MMTKNIYLISKLISYNKCSFFVKGFVKKESKTKIYSFYPPQHKLFIVFNTMQSLTIINMMI